MNKELEEYAERLYSEEELREALYYALSVKGYIINNCNCKGSDYEDYILVYISYRLLDKIIELFNLDEIMLIENELFK
jgi:hypothetical protein